MPVFVVRSKGIVGFLGGRRQVAIGRSVWNGGFGVGRGRCRSSPFGGGGPCEAWWRGTRGVSCPLYVTRLRACPPTRSEEHTSELQSLMRKSYAVDCLQKKNTTKQSN